MIKVIRVITQVFRKHYLEHSPEFQEGFKTAIRLITIGFENSTQYNWHFEADKLIKENKELKKIIQSQKQQLEVKIKALDEVSLFSSSPSKTYKEYLVDCEEKGSFTVITNMDSELFSVLLYNFGIRYSYKKSDEAKSKLLSYINSKNNVGYYAFKDKKSYNRFTNGRT